ncbi:uncharacterized protein LOC117325960 isoform X2 [Pecten maximus]|uniref:uncharacterized protein LOC117325960 isoform X1 n=1 Tax=Pecten maximus TaxID=6579 RepID=UPI001457E6C3|nr:uncharacterized protein LOC117325960 isoform X1 [Pecten maximus]XP_033738387.1 uncharacterized protein LOC117325960 isoform X2 [Pecten maximus]
MARNEEKQLGRLNRLLLKQDKEEQEKKNPKRPRLDDLNSSEDIKKWIPSIKRDIDFCLKQSQVPCYPDSKIQECNSRIDSLRRQYWAFIRKLRHLDPSTGSIPWTDRHYTPKKRQHSPGHHYTDDETEKKQQCIANSSPGVTSPVSSSNGISHRSFNTPDRVISPVQTIPGLVDCSSDFSPISTPLLDNDTSYQTLYGYEPGPRVVMDGTTNPALNDQPLTFITKDISAVDDSLNGATEPVGEVFDQTERHLNDSTQDESLTYTNSESIGTVTGSKAASSLIPYSDSSDNND